MNKRVQWRAVMLVTMATIAFGLSVRSYAATTPAPGQGARPTIERYNPYIDGDRLVFTQVTRQADDSTTAAVWARDLASGRESLVANVGTGEPMPVTNGSWTAWSEMVSDTHSVVRARANRGGPVLDVFTTQATPFETFGSPNKYLPTVALAKDRLVTTNGTFVPTEVPEIATFDLPSTRPRYVDVFTTSDGRVWRSYVSATEHNITLSNVGPRELFFVLDDNGRLLNSPNENCFALRNDASRAVMSGNRVAIAVACDFIGAAIATCLVPCASVELFPLGLFPADVSPQLISLSGDTAAFAVRPGFVNQLDTVQLIDLSQTGTAPRVIRRTSSGSVGPRVSIDGNRVTWDEFSVHNGVARGDLFVHDLRSGVTTMIDSQGRTSATPRPDDVRLEPDINGQRVVYTTVPKNGRGASIWMRSLDGRPRLVSTFASDGSIPRLGADYAAWNVPTAPGRTDRIVAARVGARGSGAVIDIYSTSTPLTKFGRDAPPTRAVMDGNRVAINSFVERPNFLDHAAVFDRLVTDPGVRQLTPDDEFRSVSEIGVSAADGYTLTQPLTALFSEQLALYAPDGSRTGLGLLAPFCAQQAVVSSGGVFAVSDCVDGVTALAACSLPCTAGLTDTGRRLPSAFTLPQLFQSNLTALAAGGTQLVIRRQHTLGGGRYRDGRVLLLSSIDVVDLSRPDSPRSVTAESGKVSEPRTDGTTIVWSVDRTDDVRTGELWAYDVSRGTVSAL